MRYREFANHRLAELQVLTCNLALRRTLRGRVDLVTLQMLLENNAAALVDVRPAAEFAAGLPVHRSPDFHPVIAPAR